MAITKLLRIKEAKNRSSASAHLKDNIAYICRDDKTEGGLWIGGNAGNTAEAIYKRMIRNKEFWGKTDGSQGFHYVISFSPDSGVTPALASQIAEEFTEELLHGDFYYVTAVHTDTDHLHVHVTFDSVSKTDGYKFHSPKGDWEKRIQPITDRICKKYGLPSLTEELDEKGYEKKDRRGADYGDHKKQKMRDFQNDSSGSRDEKSEKKKKGRVDKETYFSWLDIMRDDIDEAILRADSYEEFLEILKNDHYLIRDKGSLSLKLPEMGRPIRTGRLGTGYSKEEILFRIKNKTQGQNNSYRYRTYGDWIEMQKIIYVKIERTPTWKPNHFQRQFYRRWENTFFIRRPDRRPQAWKYKKDIKDSLRMSAAFGYAVDHDIKSPEAAYEELEKIQTEIKSTELELKRKRERLRSSQLFYHLSVYEKMEKQYQAEPDAETEKELRKLKEQIEKKCTLEEAVEQREELKNQIASLKEIQKAQRKEEQTVEDMFRLLFGVTAKEWKNSQDKNKKQDAVNQGKTCANETSTDTSEAFPKDDMPTWEVTDDRPVIRVNEKMFSGMKIDEGYCITRIPYQKDRFAELPLEDCRIIHSGKTLEVKISDEREYRIFDGNGKFAGTMTGERLRENYTKKETKEQDRPKNL